MRKARKPRNVRTLRRASRGRHEKAAIREERRYEREKAGAQEVDQARSHYA